MADNPIYTGEEKLTLRQLNIYGELIKNYTDTTFATKKELEDLGVGGDYTSINEQIENINDSLDDHKSDENIHVNSAKQEMWNNKAEKTDIPTKLSELNNDVSYIKNTVDNLINYYSKSETYSKDEVKNLISALGDAGSSMSISTEDANKQMNINLGTTDVVYF